MQVEEVVLTMRRFLLIPVAGLFWISLAAAQSIYQIDLRDHATYLSEDRPVERGRVALFHRHPDGVLLSIPKDEVARVACVPAGAATRALLPGEAIDVGITGGSPRPETASPEENGVAAPSGGPYGAMSPGSADYAGGYGGGAPRYGGNANMGSSSPPPPGTSAGPTMGNPMTPSLPRGGHR